MTTEAELQAQLREAAAQLDHAAVPVGAEEAVRSQPAPTRRHRHGARVLAVAAAAIGAALVAVGLFTTQDDTPLVTADRDAGPTVERRDLYGASHSVVDDELWVFGGLAASPGTAPPITSPAPPGWTANNIVTVFGADGSVRRRFELEGLAGRTLSGWVFAAGDDRYLLGNVCNGTAGGGCGGTYEPYLVRFDSEHAVPVPLRLPEGDIGDMVGSGAVTLIGHTADGLLWLSQEVAQQPGLTLYPTRLLAVDVKTGVGTEVDLPDGLVRRGTLCLSGGILYATQATLEDLRLVGLRIMSRLATTDPADWSVLVEPPLELEQVSGGSLACLPQDEIAMLVAASPNAYLLTYSTGTGRPVHDRYDLPPDARFIGQIEDRTVLASRTGPDTLTIVTHDPGQTWTSTDAEITSDTVPVVLGGQLTDVGAALTSIGPDDLDFPTIDY